VRLEWLEDSNEFDLEGDSIVRTDVWQEAELAVPASSMAWK